MITAKEAGARISKLPKLSVEEYLEGRIEQAVNAGYSSSKVWVKKEQLPDALALLVKGGFKSEVIMEELRAVQLEVFW
jgi:hypothetical protein